MNYLLLVIPILGLIINTTKLRKIFYFGIFFHELGHYIFAKLLGLKVYETNWLKSVRIESPRSAWKTMLICFAPFMFSFFLSALILRFTLNTPYDIIGVFIATGMVLHSSSSKQDFKNFLRSLADIFKGKGGFLDYLILMIIILMFVLSLIGYASFDITYLLLVAVLIAAFMILSVITMFGELANIVLLILMIFVFSGETDITTIIQSFKTFLDNINLLIKSLI